MGHKSIIDLKGVPCEEIEFEDSHGYQFFLNEEPTFSHLSEDEKAILDIVIEKLGNLKKDEVIDLHI